MSIKEDFWQAAERFLNYIPQYRASQEEITRQRESLTRQKAESLLKNIQIYYQEQENQALKDFYLLSLVLGCKEKAKNTVLEQKLEKILRDYGSLQKDYLQLQKEQERGKALVSKADAREKRIRDLETVCSRRTELIKAYKREDVERRLATLKATHSPFVYLDQRGIVTDISPEALELLRTKREILEKRHYTYFLKVGADFSQTQFLRGEYTLGNGEEDKLTVNIKIRGETRKVAISVAPVYEPTLTRKKRLAGTIIKFKTEDEAKEHFVSKVLHLLFGDPDKRILPEPEQA